MAAMFGWTHRSICCQMQPVWCWQQCKLVRSAFQVHEGVVSDQLQTGHRPLCLRSFCDAHWQHSELSSVPMPSFWCGTAMDIVFMISIKQSEITINFRAAFWLLIAALLFVAMQLLWSCCHYWLLSWNFRPICVFDSEAIKLFEFKAWLLREERIQSRRVVEGGSWLKNWRIVLNSCNLLLTALLFGNTMV